MKLSPSSEVTSITFDQLGDSSFLAQTKKMEGSYNSVTDAPFNMAYSQE